MMGVSGFLQTCLWLILSVVLFPLHCLRVSQQLSRTTSILQKHLTDNPQQLFWHWLFTDTQKQLLIKTLRQAQRWEEYEAAANTLDHLLGNDEWRKNATYQLPKNYYDDGLIERRTRLLEGLVESGDVMGIHEQLRTNIRRHLGGITKPKLYNKANAGTKLLIEDYVRVTCQALRMYAAFRPRPEVALTAGMKQAQLRATGTSYGRSVLVLQGGSIFGLRHLGIVKAMYQRGLLPRIIAGSATGALMAAWVGVHTEEELLGILSGDRIDLSAFVASSQRAAARAHGEGGGWLMVQLRILYRRARRFFKSGFILDPVVLEEAVRANVGDLTFREAHDRTGRVLNITIGPSGPGSITLLNYHTAPHVLIWSAALVSNINNRYSNQSIRLMCKDELGRTVPYNNGARFNYNKVIDTPEASPLSRLGELYNVEHYIISQARPYFAPFLYTTLRSFKTSWSTYIAGFVLEETQHQLRQLNVLGILSPGVKRLLMDEVTPGPSITLVPYIGFWDWWRLLRNPTAEEINHWIGRGEKSVWPNVVELWVRLAVEFELGRANEMVHRFPEGVRERGGGGAARART
jgi:TAG lipase/lysophosphatidylethanolamine acyltransferase